MPQPLKFTDISKQLWDSSSTVFRWGERAVKDGGAELSAEIKVYEELNHPGSYIMHASIVWLVMRWEECPSPDDRHVYWMDAISIASIADVVALIQSS